MELPQEAGGASRHPLLRERLEVEPKLRLHRTRPGGASDGAEAGVTRLHLGGIHGAVGKVLRVHERLVGRARELHGRDAAVEDDGC